MPTAGSAYDLPLSGSLTTSRADILRSEILAAVRDHRSVLIDCSQAQDMDVAFIQILVAASRFAERNGKTVALAASPGGLLTETLRRCGFRKPSASASNLADVLSLSGV